MKIVSTKALLVVVVLVAIGLPIQESWEFLTIVFSGFFIGMGSVKQRPIFIGCFLTLAVCLAVFRFFLFPVPYFLEGAHFFLPGSKQTMEDTPLPSAVYLKFKEHFDEKYPNRSDWCNGVPLTEGHCWTAFKQESPYAFSADAIFYDSQGYSRRSRYIDFHNVQTMRGGFINFMGSGGVEYTNWFDWLSKVRRTEMPFYVEYAFSPNYIGSKLCWRGLLAFPQGTDFRFVMNADKNCIDLTAEVASRPVYGLSMGKDGSLDITLKPPSKVRNLDRVYATIAVALVVILLAFTVRISLREQVVEIISFWAFGVASLLYFGFYLSFSRVIVHRGGDDGLTYAGWGLSILRHLWRGEYYLALRGQEDVFYFMPGLRYFRALELIFFGNTNYGYLILLIMTPLVLSAIFRLFLGKLASITLAGVFSYMPASFMPFWSLAGAAGLASAGYAEPMANLVFLTGVLLLCKDKQGLENAILQRFFVAGICLGISLFLRPNLIFAIFFLACFVVFKLRGSNLYRVWSFGAGAAIFGLAPLMHNLYFGGRFVMFTTATVVNIHVHPAVYYELLRSIAHLNWDWVSAAKIGVHLTKFVTPVWPKTAVLMTAVIAFFTRRFWLSTHLSKQYQALWLAATGLVLPFFVYTPEGRYGILPWTVISILALIPMISLTTQAKALISKFR